MKRIHPNVSRAVTCAATCATITLALGVCGCRSTSSGVTNPFLAPDRVPPPSTHVLLPGQAQPYYQGDPLPAMQTRTNPPVTSAVTSQNNADAISSSGRRLAWAAPGSNTPTNLSPPPQPAIATPTAPQFAFSNEAPVAVPADADPLRFALPAPRQPENPTPVAASVPPPNTQPVQLPATQPTPSVQLATYNAPVAANPPTPVAVPTFAAPAQVNSPWRAPQVPATAAQPVYAVQPGAVQPIGQAPLSLPAPPIAPPAPAQVAVPTNTMPVTLRPVASPTEPGDAIPRIRVPGYIAPQITASDGFRPRTTMQ